MHNQTGGLLTIFQKSLRTTGINHKVWDLPPLTYRDHSGPCHNRVIKSVTWYAPCDRYLIRFEQDLAYFLFLNMPDWWWCSSANEMGRSNGYINKSGLYYIQAHVLSLSPLESMKNDRDTSRCPIRATLLLLLELLPIDSLSADPLQECSNMTCFSTINAR